MSFSDEKLKDLKWCIAQKGEAYISGLKMSELVARLEAAELVCDVFKDLPISAWLIEGNAPSWTVLIKSIEAWRKFKGLSDSEEPAGEVK